MEGAALGNEQIEPAVTLEEPRAFGVDAAGACPKSLFLADERISLQVDFAHPDFGVVAILRASLLAIGQEISFAVVKEQ